MSSTQLSPRYPGAVTNTMASAAEPAVAGLAFVFFYWWFLFFEPETFLTNTIGGPWYRVGTLLLPFIFWVGFRVGFDRVQYWPMTALLLLHAIASVVAANRGFSLVAFKVLLPFYFAMAATRATFRKPEHVEKVLRLFLYSFIWYALFGIPGGRVSWHPNLDNEDTFGPLMGIAFGLYYYIGMGSRNQRLKWLSYGVCLIGMIGVVASFARGAVIAIAVVAGMIWLRSPQKLATLLGGAIAGVIYLLASLLLFDGVAFWAEMMSIAEGTESGTGQARWIMWQMAIDVWMTSPIWGVGAGNFGVIASQIVEIDWDRPMYTHPAQLYNQALHSVYFQILSEEGLIGCFLWLYMAYDFHRRIFRLLTKSAAAVWTAKGGTLDLRCLAYGLEAAMIGFHINAVFYNQIYVHWFWTMLTLVLVLTHITEGEPPSPAAPEPDSTAVTAATTESGQEPAFANAR